jgi:signal peptidase
MILLGVEKTETNINVENAPSMGYKTVKFLQTVVTYLIAVCIVIAALLFAVNKSPQKSLFGFRYYTVLTPSMEPAYSVGDLVIVKLTNADNISVGDVITFNPSSDSDAYLTHRVTEKLTDYEGTGVTCFRTKGDANDTEDSFLIDSSRVIGTVSFGIPKLGYIIRLFS